MPPARKKSKQSRRKNAANNRMFEFNELRRRINTLGFDDGGSSSSQPTVVTNITPQVEIRDFEFITQVSLIHKVLVQGLNRAKRLKTHGETLMVLKCGGDDRGPDLVIDIQDNAPDSALTLPRASALAALGAIKEGVTFRFGTCYHWSFYPQFETLDMIWLPQITDEGRMKFIRSFCVKGCRYIGKFIAQEMPDRHPGKIPKVGNHENVGFEDGDLGLWKAALVLMDYSRVTHAKFARPYAKSLVEYVEDNSEVHNKKVTKDAFKYMGWEYPVGKLSPKDVAQFNRAISLARSRGVGR